MDTTELFYRDISSLIQNLLCDNPNYTNRYFHNQHYSKWDLLKDTQERARYILERMEDTKHLLSHSEPEGGSDEQSKDHAESGNPLP